MHFKRSNRVADQILREISRMLCEDVKDPRIGMVTISRVRLTDDLRYARVYYTVYGDEEQRKETQSGLVRATGFIRRQLGNCLRLRFIPELVFHFDASLDHVERITSLLKEIKQHDVQQPVQGADVTSGMGEEPTEPGGSSLNHDSGPEAESSGS